MTSSRSIRIFLLALSLAAAAARPESHAGTHRDFE
jgi:hypothetical protein